MFPINTQVSSILEKARSVFPSLYLVCVSQPCFLRVSTCLLTTMCTCLFSSNHLPPFYPVLTFYLESLSPDFPDPSEPAFLKDAKKMPEFGTIAILISFSLKLLKTLVTIDHYFFFKQFPLLLSYFLKFFIRSL